MGRPDLESIYFPANGWTEEERTPTEVSWKNAGTYLSLHFFPRPPDLAAPLHDIDRLRTATRGNIDDAGGGIVQIDRIDVQGIEALQQILKFHTEDGNAYIGSITLPFREFSFVVKAQSMEEGPTGLRESRVADQLMRERDEDPAELMARFHADPYDPSHEPPVRPSLRALSDDESYDDVIPDHPLSLVRRSLVEFSEDARFGVELFKAPGFDAD